MAQTQIAEDPAKNERLLRQILASPAAKVIFDEDAAEVARERLRLGNRLGELDAECIDRSREFEKAKSVAVADYEKTRKIFEELSRQLASMHTVFYAWSWRVNSEKNAIEDALVRTSAPQLLAFYQELLDVMDTLRRDGLSTSPMELRTPLIGAPTRIVVSNGRMLRELMERISSAIASAREAMQWPDQSTVDALIAKLREGIGSMDAASLPLEEFEIHRPQFVRETAK